MRLSTQCKMLDGRESGEWSFLCSPGAKIHKSFKQLEITFAAQPHALRRAMLLSNTASRHIMPLLGQPNGLHTHDDTHMHSQWKSPGTLSACPGFSFMLIGPTAQKPYHIHHTRKASCRKMRYSVWGHHMSGYYLKCSQYRCPPWEKKLLYKVVKQQFNEEVAGRKNQPFPRVRERIQVRIKLASTHCPTSQASSCKSPEVVGVCPML